MNNMSFLPILLVVALMAGCGGNDGRGTSHSSSITSSSSSLSTTCNSFEGAVFVDDVCSPWQDVSIYEQLNQSPWTNHEITDGRQGEAVTFSIIDSADAGHHQVLDVRYAPESDYSGVVRIRAPENNSGGLDMSEYATGKIQFDLKVISEGTLSPDLELVIECGYPCGNTPKIVKPDSLNQWKTFEFPVADLIDRGLDIKHVGLGFMLLPTWGKQVGVHMQIDNILWVKGDAQVVTENPCFANYLDTQWIPDVGGTFIMTKGESFTIPAEQQATMTKSVFPYANVMPDWSQMKGVWAFGVSEGMELGTGNFLETSTLYDCSASGILSIDIYVTESLVVDGTMTFRIIFGDGSHNIHEVTGEEISVSSLTPNDWNRISVNLSSNDQINDVRYVGLLIDSTNIKDDLEGYLYIDNFLIKQNATN